MSDQANTELYERAFDVLCKVAPMLDNAELGVLCHLCGLSYKDVVNASEADMEPSKRRNFIEEAIDAYESLKDR